MTSSYEVMVIAGQSGSKSTFIGGLRQHAVEEDGVTPVPTPVEGDVDGDYFDGIVKQMSTRRKYPKQTENGYVMKLRLSYGGSMMRDTEFNLIDIPGEEYDLVLSNIRDDIINNNIDEDAVSREFEKVLPKISSKKSVDIPEWETLIKHYYTQAEKVIFLLNINKVIVESELLTVDNQLIQAVSDEKNEVAVIPTAVDLINYDPGDPDMKGKAFLGGYRTYDQKLEDHLDEHIPDGAAPKFNSILNLAEANDQVDFFSVAVPAADPQDPSSNALAPRENSTSGFKTQGFEVVFEWLQQ